MGGDVNGVATIHSHSLPNENGRVVSRGGAITDGGGGGGGGGGGAGNAGIDDVPVSMSGGGLENVALSSESAREMPESMLSMDDSLSRAASAAEELPGRSKLSICCCPRRDGKYSQVKPLREHLLHVGLSLVHLSLELAQLEQLSLSLQYILGEERSCDEEKKRKCVDEWRVGSKKRGRLEG